MTRAELLSRLEVLPACAEARAWAAGTPGTPEELWATCPRGDWLLWLAASAGVDRCVVVLAACDCTETAAPHLTDTTRGPALAALEVTRKWARGEATQRDVRNANAALTGREDGYAVDRAACAVAFASYAAFVSVRSVAADDVSMAATYASSAVVGEDARTGLRRCADLVRARIPWATVEAALIGGAS